MSQFFIKYKLEKDRRKCKKIEDMIEELSRQLLYDYNQVKDNKPYDEDEATASWCLCQSDFNDMINEIKQVYISSSYLGLYSWLLDRAFLITDSINNDKNVNDIKRMTDNNKALLMSVLYKINPQNLLKCFSKNVQKV